MHARQTCGSGLRLLGAAGFIPLLVGCAGVLPAAATLPVGAPEGAPKETRSAPSPDRGPAKGVKARYRALPPSPRKAAGTYALDGTPSVPSWGRGTHPEQSRDDDLLTLWQCDIRGGGRCALSLRFSEPAQVGLLRIFGSTGATYAARRAAPRVKRIKVHTDQGWVRATLRDYWGHQYVQLDPPVKTGQVTVEVDNVYRGAKGSVVGIAEVEAFGSSGPKRAPLELDPRTVVVRGSPDFYASGHWLETKARRTWIEVVAHDGTVRRILSGGGLLGEPGDRYLLVPTVSVVACATDESLTLRGSFVIVDRLTRHLLSGGPAVSPGGFLWRHRKGRGFAGTPHPFEGRWEDDGMDIRTSELAGKASKAGRVSVPCRFTDGGCFHREAAKLGYDALTVPDESGRRCKELSLAEARKLVPVAELYGGGTRPVRGDKLRLCEVGEGRKLLVVSMPCERSRAVLLGPSGKTLSKAVTGDSAGLRLRQHPGGPLLVETGQSIHVVAKGRDLDELLPHARFSIYDGPHCDCAAYTGRGD